MLLTTPLDAMCKMEATWIKSHYPRAGMKISDIFVYISLIYPISVMFDTISVMTDISSIYWFWTDISWKYQVCGTRTL